MRVRLKPTCGYPDMNTPGGLVNHEWKEAKDGAYIYKEMEIEGQEEKVPTEEVLVKELAAEEVTPEEGSEEIEEEETEEEKEEEPVVKKKPQKKVRKKKK